MPVCFYVFMIDMLLASHTDFDVITCPTWHNLCGRSTGGASLNFCNLAHCAILLILQYRSSKNFAKSTRHKSWLSGWSLVRAKRTDNQPVPVVAHPKFLYSSYLLKWTQIYHESVFAYSNASFTLNCCYRS